MSNDSTGKTGGLSFADTLSPLERAAIGLQANLSLFEVGKLTFPDNAKFQQSLVQTLISNAKAGNLTVYGNPDGWESRTCEETRNFRLGTLERVFENPFPATNLHQGTTGPISYGCYLDSPNPLPTKKEWAGNCCLVTHADYFAFLKTPLALGIPEPKWLGATPAIESPPALPTLPAEPSRPEQTAKPVAIGVNLRPDQQDKRDCQQIARELWAEHPEWIQADLLKHPRIKSYVTQWKGKNTVPGWLSEVDPRPKERRRGCPPKTR